MGKPSSTLGTRKIITRNEKGLSFGVYGNTGLSHGLWVRRLGYGKGVPVGLVNEELKKGRCMKSDG